MSEKNSTLRTQAKSRGEPRYTGVTCDGCEGDTYYTSSGSCVVCSKLRRVKPPVKLESWAPVHAANLKINYRPWA